MANLTIAKEKTNSFKMSKEHKEMFIEALRSGDYNQTTGAYVKELEGPNGKPCLCAAGVYLAQLNEVEDLLDAEEMGDMCSIDFGEFHLNPKHDLIGHIIDMNDGLNCTFEMIAMWIEEKVEGVDAKELTEY